MDGLGLRDLLTADAVLLVEWPSRGAGVLPPADVEVRLGYPNSGEGRELRILAHSPLGDRVVQRFVAEMSE